MTDQPSAGDVAKSTAEHHGTDADRTIRIGKRVVEAMAVNMLSAIPILGPSFKAGIETFLKEIRKEAADESELDEQRILNWIAQLPEGEFNQIIATVLARSNVPERDELREDLFRNMSLSRDDLTGAIESAKSAEFHTNRVLREFDQFGMKFRDTDPSKLPKDYWKTVVAYQIRLGYWGPILAAMPRLYAEHPLDETTIKADRLASKNFRWDTDHNSRLATILFFAFPFLLSITVGRALLFVGLGKFGITFTYIAMAIGVIGGISYFAGGPFLLTKTTYPLRRRIKIVANYVAVACLAMIGLAVAMGWIDAS